MQNATRPSLSFLGLTVLVACTAGGPGAGPGAGGTGGAGGKSDGAAAGRVLVVVSAADTLRLKPTSDGTPRSVPSGFFLNELAETLRQLEAAGYAIDIATPGGARPTIDLNSFEMYFYKMQVISEHEDLVTWFESIGLLPAFALAGHEARAQRLEDVETAFRYFGALRFSANQEDVSAGVADFADEVDRMQEERGLTPAPMLALEELADDSTLDRYDGVYVPGGHAPKMDLVYSEAFGDVLRHFHAQKKPTALICHAPVTLLATVDGWTPDEEPSDARLEAFPYRGYAVSIGSRPEEWVLENFLYLVPEREEKPLVPEQVLEFYVSDQLKRFDMDVNPGGRAPSMPEVVVDRELLTGANPSSTAGLARAFVAALEGRGADRGKEGTGEAFVSASWVADGLRFEFEVDAPDEADQAVIWVDGYEVAEVYPEEGRFVASYDFYRGIPERAVEVVAYEKGRPIASAFGMLDSSGEPGVTVQPRGPRTYTIGLVNAPSEVESVAVEVRDGGEVGPLEDRITGATHDRDGDIQHQFSEVGTRRLWVAGFDASGEVVLEREVAFEVR